MSFPCQSLWLLYNFGKIIGHSGPQFPHILSDLSSQTLKIAWVQMAMWWHGALCLMCPQISRGLLEGQAYLWSRNGPGGLPTETYNLAGADCPKDSWQGGIYLWLSQKWGWIQFVGNMPRHLKAHLQAHLQIIHPQDGSCHEFLGNLWLPFWPRKNPSLSKFEGPCSAWLWPTKELPLWWLCIPYKSLFRHEYDVLEQEVSYGSSSHWKK